MTWIRNVTRGWSIHETFVKCHSIIFSLLSSLMVTTPNSEIHTFNENAYGKPIGTVMLHKFAQSCFAIYDMCPLNLTVPSRIALCELSVSRIWRWSRFGTWSFNELWCYIYIYIYIYKHSSDYAFDILRPKQYGCHFPDDFSNRFSWMKLYKFRAKVYWRLLHVGKLTISQHWSRW